MIIDMHTHIVPKDFPFLANRPSGDAFPSMSPKDEERSTIMISGEEYRTVRDVCWDAPKRAAEMAGQGTDKQVLSPLPELLMYHLDPKDGADLARHLNETIAGMVTAEPERFYGLGSVPMQDVELAVAELGVIKELGLHGVEIRSNIEGRSLGEERFRPFFNEAAALDLAVFPHANRPTFADRLAHIPPIVADAPLGSPSSPGWQGRPSYGAVCWRSCRTCASASATAAACSCNCSPAAMRTGTRASPSASSSPRRRWSMRPCSTTTTSRSARLRCAT